MNEPRNTISDVDLDRLTDDELTAAERTELLRALDASPDGWRRCALAFVEAQTLRRELGAMVAAAEASTASPPRPNAERPGLPTWLALAASLIAAFGVGVAAHRAWSPVGAGSGAQFAHSDAAPSEATTEEVLVVPEQSVAAAPPQRSDSPDPDVVTFWTRDERGERQSLRARLIDADELQERFGVRLKSAAPPELHEQFRRRGLRLESKQRYAPLNTDDGGTFVVPVQDMRVTPVNYL